MPIAPAVPFGGLNGLRFIERTYDNQFATFNKSPDIEREVEYFLENAVNITSAEELVGDRRLMAVVLGAFGLDEDIGKGAFIRKILEDGTTDQAAFANRLVEPAYKEMSAFLGFGDLGGTLIFENTRLNLVDRYRERQFELAVGEQDIDLRLAMNFKREFGEILSSSGSDDTAWLRVLGSPPLREVIETALNLPSEFALIDLDQQVSVVKDRAERIFGTSQRGDLLQPGAIDEVTERFMLNGQLRDGVISSSTRGSIALSLLQSSALGAGAQANLFASNLL